MATVERDDELIDSGLRYRRGEPVRVQIAHRGGRCDISDDGAGVRAAGLPIGWHEVATRVVEGHALNLNRRGVVFVPAFGARGIDALTERVAHASRDVYLALLELDDG